MLGVAVFVGMHTANQSVLFAFERHGRSHRRQDRAAGDGRRDRASTKRCSSACSRFAEVRVAVPVIEAVVGTRIAGQGNLLILGVDMTGDRSLRDYDLESGDEAVIDDPLVFLAQPDSIIVTNEFADAERPARSAAS